MIRTVANFSGANWLSRADEALLDLAADIYIAAFVKIAPPVGALTTIISKLSNYDLSLLYGAPSSYNVLFSSENGSTQAIATSPINDVTLWHFVEGFRENGVGVRCLVTPVTATTLTPFASITSVTLTGATNTHTNQLRIGAGSGDIFRWVGQMHSMILASQLPTDAEREFLFAKGAGREYWEFSTALKGKTVAFWPLSESSGSRASKKNSLSLTDNSSVGSTTRTVTVAPHCIESTPLQKLRELVAASPAFQDWVGDTTESAALSSTYITANESDVTNRPNAIIYEDESGIGNSRDQFPSGSIIVVFESPIVDTDTEEERTIFRNRIGKIIQEVMEISQEGGRLYLRSIDRVQDISISSPKKTAGKFYSLAYAAAFGVGGGQ